MKIAMFLTRLITTPAEDVEFFGYSVLPDRTRVNVSRVMSVPDWLAIGKPLTIEVDLGA